MMLYISSEPYSDHYSCTANMKKFVVFAAVILVVGSAPTLNQVSGVDPRQDYYRDVRSQYPQYVSPCAAAAASAPIPAIAPAAAYQLNIAPYHYAQPSPYYAHYRSEEPEIMSYSDMDPMMSEHMQARYGYPAPRSYAPTPTGHVFGVFPNANSGGCNVPLLFSCTPSIVPGHVVPQQHAADAYRGVELSGHHEDSLEEHPVHEHPAHEHLNPADSNHAMHQ